MEVSLRSILTSASKTSIVVFSLLMRSLHGEVDFEGRGRGCLGPEDVLSVGSNRSHWMARFSIRVGWEGRPVEMLCEEFAANISVVYCRRRASDSMLWSKMRCLS